MAEEWRQINEFRAYSVSDRGRIRNDITDRIMVLSPNQTGIVYVGLMHNGVQYKRSVARLVAEAFIDSPNSNHDTPMFLDGDRNNLATDNVVYRPRWYAINYMRQFEERFHSPISYPLREIASGDVYDNSWHASTHNGLLEKEVVFSVLNATYVWPTYQQFETAA